MAQRTEEYFNNGVVKRTMIFDDDKPDDFTVKTECDYTSLGDTNRALADEIKRLDTNKILARVPMTIYEQSVREKWDDGDWKKFLNDPDNKVFRVFGGRV